LPGKCQLGLATHWPRVQAADAWPTRTAHRLRLVSRSQKQPKILGLSALPSSHLLWTTHGSLEHSVGCQESHTGKPKINVNLDIVMIMVAQGNYDQWCLTKHPEGSMEGVDSSKFREN